MLNSYDAAAETNAKGRLILREPREFARALKAFPRGVALTVHVETRRESRTSAQNRYYFGVLLPLLTAHLHAIDKLAVHEWCKREFNPITITIGGVTHTVGGSTRALAPEAFARYLDRIRAHAAAVWFFDLPPAEDPREVRA